MNISLNKNYDTLSVSVYEFSSDGNFDLHFLTSNPVEIDSKSTQDIFDFVSLSMYDPNKKELVSVTIGKDALSKFICMMENIVNKYNKKNKE